MVGRKIRRPALGEKQLLQQLGLVKAVQKIDKN
jgi:hypothetical protein